MSAAGNDSGVDPTSPIPDKLYFKIGEVAQLVGVQPHVLRYWEKEIPSIRPTKSPSNQRRYRRRDVETFREIRRLLYEERFTLAGARRQLGGKGSPGVAEPEPSVVARGAVPEAAAASAESQAGDADQLPLGFSRPEQGEKLERVKAGLRDLVRLAGEEP